MPSTVGSWESIPSWMGLSLLPLALACCDLFPKAGHLRNSLGTPCHNHRLPLVQGHLQRRSSLSLRGSGCFDPWRGQGHACPAQHHCSWLCSPPPAASAGWQGQRWHLPITGELLLCHLRMECVNWKHDSPPLNTQRNGMGDGAQLSRAAFIIHGGERIFALAWFASIHY